MTKQELKYYPDKTTLMEYKEFYEDNLVIHRTYYPNGNKKYTRQFFKDKILKKYYNIYGNYIASSFFYPELNITVRQLNDELGNYITFSDNEDSHVYVNSQGDSSTKNQKVKYFTYQNILKGKPNDFRGYGFEIAAIPISVMSMKPDLIHEIKNIVHARGGYIFWYVDFE